MKKVLIYGQSSYDNRGCEALLTTTSKLIKENKNYSITCATFDYNGNKTQHIDLIDKYVRHYVTENDLSSKMKKELDYYKSIPFDYNNYEKIYEHEVFEEINDSDICLSIGGDNFCYGESNWLYAICNQARKLNKKNVLWCASLFEKIEDPEMLVNLKKFDLLMVRESLSYDVMKAYINEDRLLKVVDPAFGLKAQKIKLNSHFDKKVIAINISPLVMDIENKTFESVVYLINELLNTTDYHIALLPHVYIEGNNDLDALKPVKESFKNNNRVFLVNEKKYSCGELKYIISKCEALIAARTHASIAGYSSLVPTLVIGYSVKSKGIAKDLFGNYDDYVISYDEISGYRLLLMLHKLLNNKNQIKKQLKDKMKKYVPIVNNLFNITLERLDYLEKKNVTHESCCTGCSACLNVCPHDAIIMKENETGFINPFIVRDKCVECNLCREVCPANNAYNYKYGDLKVYASYYPKNTYDNSSSSGAIFPVLAANILKQKGIVYGCSEKAGYKHVKIDDINNLNDILGSKYVQSKIDLIYQDVEKNLISNKKVLFSGTPCQIEALKSFVKKNYSNLYTVSVICHGTPNQMYLKKYFLDRFNTTDVKINFRAVNEKGEKILKYNFEDKKEETPFFEDPLIKSFLNNYSLMPACFHCDFKLFSKNTSDLIIGDFWGVNEYYDIRKNKVSLVVVNSNKGKKLISTISDELYMIESSLEKALPGNPVLTKVIKPNLYNDFFMREVFKEDIINLIYKYEKKEREEKVLKENKTKIDDLTKKLSVEVKEKEKIRNELTNIYNSRKWKLISLILNPIIKLRNKIYGNNKV